MDKHHYSLAEIEHNDAVMQLIRDTYPSLTKEQIKQAMEKQKLNLIEKLASAPSGILLYSPLCGEVTLKEVNTNLSKVIVIAHVGSVEHQWMFESDGTPVLHTPLVGECMLFPSKEHRDWSDFQPRWHKHFEPFQRILVKKAGGDWNADLYSHYDEYYGWHVLVSGVTTSEDKFIIPYEGNENKVGQKVIDTDETE